MEQPIIQTIPRNLESDIYRANVIADYYSKNNEALTKKNQGYLVSLISGLYKIRKKRDTVELDKVIGRLHDLMEGVTLK